MSIKLIISILMHKTYLFPWSSNTELPSVEYMIPAHFTGSTLLWENIHYVLFFFFLTPLWLSQVSPSVTVREVRKRSDDTLIWHQNEAEQPSDPVDIAHFSGVWVTTIKSSAINISQLYLFGQKMWLSRPGRGIEISYHCKKSSIVPALTWKTTNLAL